MDEAACRRRLAEVAEQITRLPPAQRGPLEAMFAETRRRHEAIRDSGDRARSALERLAILRELGRLSRARGAADARLIDAAARGPSPCRRCRSFPCPMPAPAR